VKHGLVIFDGKIENYFGFARELGLTHLEIDLFAREQKIEMFSPKRIKEIKKLAAEAGISLSLHLPYCLNPAALIPEIYKACLKYFKKAFNLGGELGVRWVTAHPGYYQGLASWDWMRQDAMAKLKGFLEDMLVTCSSLKIPIALENNIMLPQNGQFFHLGSSVRDFAGLFSSLDSPYLRMCLDTGHANIGEGVRPYLENFINEIINIHIHDNQGDMDEHLPPGQGTVEWLPFFDYLTGHEFEGVLTIELLNDDDKKAACQYIRQGCRSVILQRRMMAL